MDMLGVRFWEAFELCLFGGVVQDVLGNKQPTVRRIVHY